MTLERFQGRWSCHYCDTTHVPSFREDELVERVNEVASDVECPLCARQLSQAKIDEWRILYCARCRGLLLRRADLITIIRYCRSQSKTRNRKPEPIDAELLSRRIDCPDCVVAMASHPDYGPGDLDIDACHDCARVWLDGGELQTSSTATWGGLLWR